MNRDNLTEICEISLGEKTNLPVQLKYYLVESICGSDGIAGIPVFGIKLDYVENEWIKDSALIRDITASSEKCIALIQRIAQDTVTPVTLKDVVEDMIAEDCMLSGPLFRSQNPFADLVRR